MTNAASGLWDFCIESHRGNSYYGLSDPYNFPDQIGAMFREGDLDGATAVTLYGYDVCLDKKDHVLVRRAFQKLAKAISKRSHIQEEIQLIDRYKGPPLWTWMIRLYVEEPKET
jgi:hypothetical protein